MRSHAFKAVLALCAFAVGEGFIGPVVSSSCKSMLRMSASPPSGLDGTRRDIIKTASAAVAGVLASTAVLPGGALAAAKPDPNRKGKREGPRMRRVCSCSCRFSLVGEAPTVLCVYGASNR